jgi:Flp pilus assembly protein TadD
MKAALRTAIANPSAGKITLPDIGAALFEMQDYPASVQAYHLACQHRPDELDLQRALIAALLHAGRRAEAVDWMRHALRFAPRDESLLYSLGMQCVALGRMNEVRDVWTALAPLNPALAQQLWTASTTGR